MPAEYETSGRLSARQLQTAVDDVDGARRGLGDAATAEVEDAGLGGGSGGEFYSVNAQHLVAISLCIVGTLD